MKTSRHLHPHLICVSAFSEKVRWSLQVPTAQWAEIFILPMSSQQCVRGKHFVKHQSPDKELASSWCPSRPNDLLEISVCSSDELNLICGSSRIGAFSVKAPRDIVLVHQLDSPASVAQQGLRAAEDVQWRDESAGPAAIYCFVRHQKRFCFS